MHCYPLGRRTLSVSCCLTCDQSFICEDDKTEDSGDQDNFNDVGKEGSSKNDEEKPKHLLRQ